MQLKDYKKQPKIGRTQLQYKDIIFLGKEIFYEFSREFKKNKKRT